MGEKKKKSQILYNVFENGNLIFENATAKEIADALGSTQSSISTASQKETPFRGVYRIDRVSVEDRITPLNIPSSFWDEWVEVTNKLKKIQWVKKGSLASGKARVLRTRKKGE